MAGLGGSPGSADGLGGGARFYSPNGIAVDGAGNLYVADTGNDTIRMISPGLVAGQTQWRVTTIAGLAGAAGSVDGTNGTARFNLPAGLAVDGAGNLFVADNANRTIRILRPSAAGGQTNWVVATIAGLAGSPGGTDGTGAAARFYNPFGIAADGTGNLYATDYESGTVRQLTPGVWAGQTNWTVSTIAGSAGKFGSADGTGSAAQFLSSVGDCIGRRREPLRGGFRKRDDPQDHAEPLRRTNRLGSHHHCRLGEPPAAATALGMPPFSRIPTVLPSMERAPCAWRIRSTIRFGR